MKNVFIVFILAALLLFAGCTTPPQDTQENSNQESEVDTTTSTQTSEEETETSSPHSELAKELAKLLENGAQQYTVEYSITSEAQGQTQTITSTNYYDLPNRIRTDASFQGFESSSYWLEDKFYSCSQDGSWSCYEFSSDSGSYEDIPDDSKSLAEKEGALDTWEYVGERIYAGTTASCFKITQSTQQATAEFCFSSSGVLLYMNTRDKETGGLLEMEALSYKESVSNSDFVLPAEPQSFDFDPSSFPQFE